MVNGRPLRHHSALVWRYYLRPSLRRGFRQPARRFSARILRRRLANRRALNLVPAVTACSSTSSNQMRKRKSHDDGGPLYWSVAAETHFLRLLADYYRENPGTRAIPKRSWNKIGEQLTVTIGKPVPHDKLTSKRERLKANYQAFKTLQKVTGLGWDPVNKAFTATEERWEEYFQEHPTARAVRDGIGDVGLYQECFDPGAASGSRTFTSRSGPYPHSIDLDNDIDVELDCDDDDGVQHRLSPSFTNGNGAGPSRGRGRGRRVNQVGNLVSAVARMAEASELDVQSRQSARTNASPLGMCQTILMSSGLDVPTYTYALHYLMLHPQLQQLFVDTEESLRWPWLELLMRSGPDGPPPPPQFRPGPSSPF